MAGFFISDNQRFGRAGARATRRILKYTLRRRAVR